jgi:hypothetical protein
MRIQFCEGQSRGMQHDPRRLVDGVRRSMAVRDSGSLEAGERLVEERSNG